MSGEGSGVGSGAGFAEAYRTAKTGVVAFDRSARGRILVGGRAPGQMLSGVLTGRIPGPLSEPPTSPTGARAYSTVLTPKGKMLSDLWVYRLPGSAEAFLLDLPESGVDAVRQHLAKVLPPRLARCEDGSGAYHLLVLAGPHSFGLVARLLGVTADSLTDLAPDQVVLGAGIVAARSNDLSVVAFDLLVPESGWGDVRETLRDRGLPWAAEDVWDTLRVEAGTPKFGSDMDEGTIPIEAGIGERAFDHHKGCYTGQEVIVRIRHRGHVNRHLRRLTLSAAGFGPGDQLFRDGGEKAVGILTSVVESPELGPVALGYVRREVEPGETLSVGVSSGGGTAVVRP